MARTSNDLCVHVGPAHVSISPAARAWGARPEAMRPTQDRKILPVAADVGGASFAEALRPHLTRRARVHVVVGDHHCRYLSITRPPGVQSRSELHAVLQAHFDASFPSPSQNEGWALACTTPPGGPIDLVSAIRQGLVASLAQATQEAQCTLVSMRPHWTAWARRQGRALRKGAHWLLSQDDSRYTVGYIESGQCLYARTAPMAEAYRHPGQIIARESALFAASRPEAMVWLAGQGWLIDKSRAPAQVRSLVAQDFWWQPNATGEGI